MELLNINNLNVTYISGKKRIRAVDNFSLSIEAGQSLGIVGESGSGKSTLAMALLRLLQEDVAEVTGTVDFMGQNLLHCSASELQKIRWEKMAVVFQKSMNALSPVHRIGKQLMDIYKVHDSGKSKQEIKNRILKLFSMVHLPERVFHLYPHELSGGMLQRVSIAMSLMHEPKFLILDEATTALDVITQRQILNEIKNLEKNMDVTWLMITHDISVVVAACKKVAVMYAGQLMEYGDVKTVINNPLHPYTKGLLQSFPTLHSENQELKGLPGTLPDLSLQPSGCIFAPRCQYAVEQCYQSRPCMVHLEGNHRVACLLMGGENK